MKPLSLLVLALVLSLAFENVDAKHLKRSQQNRNKVFLVDTRADAAAESVTGSEIHVEKHADIEHVLANQDLKSAVSAALESRRKLPGAEWKEWSPLDYLFSDYDRFNTLMVESHTNPKSELAKDITRDVQVTTKSSNRNSKAVDDYATTSLEPFYTDLFVEALTEKEIEESEVEMENVMLREEIAYEISDLQNVLDTLNDMERHETKSKHAPKLKNEALWQNLLWCNGADCSRRALADPPATPRAVVHPRDPIKKPDPSQGEQDPDDAGSEDLLTDGGDASEQQESEKGGVFPAATETEATVTQDQSSSMSTGNAFLVATGVLACALLFFGAAFVLRRRFTGAAYMAAALNDDRRNDGSHNRNDAAKQSEQEMVEQGNAKFSETSSFSSGNALAGSHSAFKGSATGTSNTDKPGDVNNKSKQTRKSSSNNNISTLTKNNSSKKLENDEIPLPSTSALLGPEVILEASHAMPQMSNSLWEAVRSMWHRNTEYKAVAGPDVCDIRSDAATPVFALNSALLQASHVPADEPCPEQKLDKDEVAFSAKPLAQVAEHKSKAQIPRPGMNKKHSAVSAARNSQSNNTTHSTTNSQTSTTESLDPANVDANGEMLNASPHNSSKCASLRAYTSWENLYNEGPVATNTVRV